MQLRIIAYEHHHYDLSNKHNIPSIHVVRFSEAALRLASSIDPNPSCCKPGIYIPYQYQYAQGVDLSRIGK